MGLLCAREEGLPPLTFVEEYLGEVHAPWRWFEMQVCKLMTEDCLLPSRVPVACLQMWTAVPILLY